MEKNKAAENFGIYRTLDLICLNEELVFHICVLISCLMYDRARMNGKRRDNYSGFGTIVSCPIQLQFNTRYTIGKIIFFKLMQLVILIEK